MGNRLLGREVVFFRLLLATGIAKLPSFFPDYLRPLAQSGISRRRAHCWKRKHNRQRYELVEGSLRIAPVSRAIRKLGLPAFKLSGNALRVDVTLLFRVDRVGQSQDPLLPAAPGDSNHLAG